MKEVTNNGCCPHCGFQNKTPYKDFVKNFSSKFYYYGSPIYTCKKCRQTFWDDRYDAKPTAIR